MGESMIFKRKGHWVLMVIILVQSCLATAWAAKITEPMDPKSIAGRIQPVGTVNVVDASGAQVVQTQEEPQALGPDAGMKRYKTSCALCHDQGVAGAPKFRDKADWSSRIALGVDGLTKSAIKGKGGMPPRGTCMQCSDEEIRLTVEYMLPQ